ncbi:MAG: class I SAM-dependent methyltransferase [Chloroflexota bacterium]|nr:class I SAM-dependent methyltransferase [Chloroflexota bacterium]
MTDLDARDTFDRDAERYDRIRPGYPDRLFDDLASVGGLPPNARILEIGVGTGQATLSLLERGYHVTGVELGTNLAALASRRLARFGNRVTIHVGPFESWPLPDEPFDAVVAFTAFHWVDATTRVPRAAAALRAGGVLATVATHHVAGGTERFFQDVQRCYERWDPTTATGLRLPPPQDVASESDEVDRSGLFGPVEFRRYERDRLYTTAEYLDVLRTYSGHQTLDPEALDGLLQCIEELIDDRYSGRIEKRYLNELRLARRLPTPWEGLPAGGGSVGSR